MFVSGGLDALRNPEAKSQKADLVTLPLTSTLGLPDDPTFYVQVNGGVQVVAGVMLAAGAFSRLAAFALAASLIPTTLAGHRFWEESDAKGRAAQRIQFLKNAAMLGGLVLVAGEAA